MNDTAAYRAAVAAAERLFADPAELAAFLTARLDEDEAVARQAIEHSTGCWENTSTGVVDLGLVDPDLGVFGLQTFEDGRVAIHVARHDPARVLREVAVKQQRLRAYVEHRETLRKVYANPDAYTFDQQLVLAIAAGVYEVLVRMDAAVHDQHPDFKQSWRVP